ncbi:MAG: hypothetical protein WBF81_05000, partial [Thermoplasmata archaeon]
MGSPGRGSVGFGGPAVGAALTVVLALLLVVPAGSLATSGSGGTRSAAVSPAASNGVSAIVTWDGNNILSAGKVSSAFQIQFNGAVNLLYTWSSVGSSAYTVSDARLQIFYFGFALATRDITDALPVSSHSGNFTMNWTTGPLQYVLEGTYRLVASLLEPNGSTVWSQSFWTQVAAPFYIGAALPIILILIVIYELYAVATVGKQAALKTPKKGKTPP